MRLFSIGDKVAPGTYQFHSRFQRAINYVLDGALLTCLLPELGSGPSHLVFKELPADDFPIEIRPQQIIFGNDQVSREGVPVFDSRITFSVEKLKVLNANLDTFWQTIQHHAPIESLAFITSPKRSRPLKTAFQRALEERLLAGFAAFQRDDWQEAVRLLKGSGSGLTPAGDDFIAGWILGLHLLDQAGSSRAKKQMALVYSAAQGENIFSNHYLALAREGRGVAAVKSLVNALGGESSSLIDRAVALMAQMGNTSGIDMAVGLWMALSKDQ